MIKAVIFDMYETLIKGVYNEAKVYTYVVDEACVEQIKGIQRSRKSRNL